MFTLKMAAADISSITSNDLDENFMVYVAYNYLTFEAHFQVFTFIDYPEMEDYFYA